MVVIRATQKVLRALPQSAADDDASTTALGDWYVNRVTVDRQRLLLFVTARSFLPLLERARNVKTIPERFPALAADRLRRLGVDQDLIDLEMAAMSTVRVGRTRSRSVLGVLVDFGKSVPYSLPAGDWDDRDLRTAEDRLAETPCLCGKKTQDVIFPVKATRKLLRQHWDRLSC